MTGRRRLNSVSESNRGNRSHNYGQPPAKQSNKPEHPQRLVTPFRTYENVIRSNPTANHPANRSSLQQVPPTRPSNFNRAVGTPLYGPTTSASKTNTPYKPLYSTAGSHHQSGCCSLHYTMEPNPHHPHQAGSTGSSAMRHPHQGGNSSGSWNK